MDFSGDDDSMDDGDDWMNTNEGKLANAKFTAELDDDQVADDDEYKRRIDKKKMFANKTGRGWHNEDWYIPEVLSSTLSAEDLPDWTPKDVSKISLERIQVHPDKIPTISTLARIPLPPPVYPHPGHGYARMYGVHRNRVLAQRVAERAQALARPHMERIQALPTFEEKQIAVDELFENVEFELKKQESVLERHPQFGKWVEQGLEKYLQQVDEESKKSFYETVLSSVSAKVEEEVTKIEFLSNDKKEEAVATALFESMEKELAEGESAPPAKDHVLFSFWVQKALADSFGSIQSSASESLMTEITPLVKDSLDANDSFVSTLNDESAGAWDERLEKVAPLVKADMEKGASFEALARRDVAHWLAQSHRQYLYKQVVAAVHPKVEHDSPSTPERQATVIASQLSNEGHVLSAHPDFLEMVSDALAASLQSGESLPSVDPIPFTADQGVPMELVKQAIEQTMNEGNEKAENTLPPYPTAEQDAESVPTYMDLFNAEDGLEENEVPKILYPMRFKERQTDEGRMIEEWELCAHKETKRIMLRQSTRKVAQVLDTCEEKPQRVLVHGKLGVGKTALLASIVSSARKSGHIVMFIPDLNHYQRYFYYVEPCPLREGMWIVPMVCQEILKSLLGAHEEDLKQFSVSRENLKGAFTDELFDEIPKKESFTLAELAVIPDANRELATGCYDTVMETLMNQEERPFVIVADEYNSLFKPGEYFHEEYDPEVKKPIPLKDVNFFKPIMDAVGLNTDDDGEVVQEPKLMKKGAVIAATSEAHDVAKLITVTLLDNAKNALKEHSDNLSVVEVPRLSKLEVEHTISNYEATGMGTLRFDNGKTVLNEQEMEYLRMVSGAVPRHLMDVCVNFEY